MTTLDDWRAPDGGTIVDLPDGTARTVDDIILQAKFRALDFDRHLSTTRLAHVKAKAARGQSLDNILAGLFLAWLTSPVLVWCLNWVVNCPESIQMP